MKFGQKKWQVLQVREESQVQKYKLGTAGEKAVLESVLELRWGWMHIVPFKKTRWVNSKSGCDILDKIVPLM